jgi:hypothetical protein
MDARITYWKSTFSPACISQRLNKLNDGNDC